MRAISDLSYPHALKVLPLQTELSFREAQAEAGKKLKTCFDRAL